MKTKGSRHGFTLAELVVMIAILSILSTGLFAVVTLSLTYYRNSMDRTTAENNVRVAVAIITNEFRQAAHWGSETTAVLLPTNANNFSNPSHELQFQELVPNLDIATMPAGALDTDSSKFQLVHYYLNSSTRATAILRTISPYDAAGNVGAPSPPSVIVSSVNGAIDLSTVFWSNNAVTIVATAQEGGGTDASNVYHPAVQDTITCNQISALYH